MNAPYFLYGLSLICAFLGSLIFTFILRRIAINKKYFDRPAKRKIHTKNMPTLGGLAIWLGFLIGVGLAFLGDSFLRVDFSFRFLGILISTLLLILAGIYDDLHDLSAHIKIIIQILGAIILIAFGFEINIISRPLGGSWTPGALSLLITILWIVGMINAINLLDGLDGLAAGVCGIAIFFLFISAVWMQIIPVAFLSISLIGAILGFLPYNFYPAKIFMGNTGSMFLGCILAVITIAGFQKRTTIFTLFVPILAMAVPIIDTFLSILRRLLKKQPIFKADREHIHHKLLIEEKTQPRVVLNLYFLTFCFGLIALGFSKLKGIYAFLALILIILLTIRWIRDWGFIEFKK